MSSKPDNPMAGSAQADETASWAASAESFVAAAPPARAARLDFSWRSLSEVDLLVDVLAAIEGPIGLKARMELAAYVGEVLVRQFGGRWATGEHYGDVLPSEVTAKKAKAKLDPAQPTLMVEKRLTEGDSLQHQVFEQSRAWAVEHSVVGSTANVDGPAAMMRLAAEAFVKSAGSNGVTWLDYSPESAIRLDGLIDEWWPASPPKDTYESMVPAMGAYLGEVLVRQTGGHWIRDPKEGYGVEFKGHVVFPLVKVSTRFELGPEQAIAQFYVEISSQWLSGHEEAPATGDVGKGKRGGLFGRGRG
jgi:ribosomal protein L27